jgi:hypothetical protein
MTPTSHTWNYLIQPVILFVILWASVTVNNSSPAFAQEPDIPVASIQALIGAESRPYGLDLAPNGEAIAWFDPNEGLCFYTFSSASRSCLTVEWPEVFKGYANLVHLEWSPDSNKILVWVDMFIPNPPIDTDIWIVDIQSGQVANLTDDGFDGFLATQLEDGTYHISEAPVEFSPIWSHNSEEVFFLRTSLNENSYPSWAQLRLESTSIGSLQNKVLYDFGEIYRVRRTPLALSGDGKTIALYLSENQNNSATSTEGIWLFNIEEETLSWLLATEDLFPAETVDTSSIRVQQNLGLIWLDEGATLLISSTARTIPIERGNTSVVWENHLLAIEDEELVSIFDQVNLSENDELEYTCRSATRLILVIPPNRNRLVYVCDSSSTSLIQTVIELPNLELIGQEETRSDVTIHLGGEGISVLELASNGAFLLSDRLWIVYGE